MNQKKFDTLVAIKLMNDKKLSQRKIANHLGFSLGSVNQLLSDLETDAYINDQYVLSKKADDFLAKHKVDRAIIMAAGMGERLMPLTLSTAEPLLNINGVVIIESIIESIKKQGIEEIIIVRGYLKEQFEYLKEKYTNIKFIDNDLYNESKNIRSIYLAKDYIENAYIFESDLLIHNPDLITPYQLNSAYYGKPTDLTHDWCFKTRSGIITGIKIGGEKVHEMVGISYWTHEDGKQLSKDIETFINKPGGIELFWDDVPLKLAKESYTVYIRDCKESDVTEINTYSQVLSLDEKYKI